MTFFWILILRFSRISLIFHHQHRKKPKTFSPRRSRTRQRGGDPPSAPPPPRQALPACILTGASGPLRDFRTSIFFLKFQKLKLWKRAKKGLNMQLGVWFKPFQAQFQSYGHFGRKFRILKIPKRKKFQKANGTFCLIVSAL